MGFPWTKSQLGVKQTCERDATPTTRTYYETYITIYPETDAYLEGFIRRDTYRRGNLSAQELLSYHQL